MSRKGQLYFVGMGVGAAIGLVGWVAFGIGGGNSDVISACGFTHTTAERRRSGGGEEDNLASAVIMPSYTAIDISGTLLEELTMAAWEEAEQKHLFKSGLDGCVMITRPQLTPFFGSYKAEKKRRNSIYVICAPPHVFSVV